MNALIIASLAWLVAGVVATAAVLLTMMPAGSRDASAGATIVVVNTTADPAPSGCQDAPDDCSLREAINAANGSVAVSQIWFNLPDCPADCTISLGATALPEITRPGLLIDGSTQPGENARVVVDFSAQPAFATGLDFGQDADGSSVVSLDLINQSGRTVLIQAENVLLQDVEITGGGSTPVDIYADGTVIVGSRINGNGSTAVSASGAGHGEIRDSQITGNDGGGAQLCGPDWTVSDTEISGNSGIAIDANACAGDAAPVVVEENVIIGNGGGVALTEGGRISGNTIDGNTGLGIFVSGGEVEITDNEVLNTAFTSGIVIQSNSRAVIQGNKVSGSGSHGISVDGVGSTIGGLQEGEGNEITNNGRAGIFVREANDDGGAARVAAAGGSGALDVTISGNKITGNSGLGIDLSPTGVNQNDEGDDDAGANRRQNHPELLSATAGSLDVSVHMDSRPEANIRLEFYLNQTCDQSGHGEGAGLIDVVDVQLPESGVLDFVADLDANVAAGAIITATATNLGTRDTSEFSNCVTVQGAATTTPTPAPTNTAAPTPTETAAPSPTSTATATPVSSKTPGPKTTQGDVDCDGDVDSVDALKQLRHVASLPVQQEPGCPAIGEPFAAAGFAGAGEPPGIFGDVDCDGDVDTVDALKVLRHVASLPVEQTEPCRDIGV